MQLASYCDAAATVRAPATARHCTTRLPCLGGTRWAVRVETSAGTESKQWMPRLAKCRMPDVPVEGPICGLWLSSTRRAYRVRAYPAVDKRRDSGRRSPAFWLGNSAHGGWRVALRA